MNVDDKKRRRFSMILPLKYSRFVNSECFSELGPFDINRGEMTYHWTLPYWHASYELGFGKHQINLRGTVAVLFSDAFSLKFLNHQPTVRKNVPPDKRRFRVGSFELFEAH